MEALKNNCWIYAGTVNKDGYGVIWDSGHNNYRLAHRVLYETIHGTIVNKLPLDHLCRQPRCINPDHLEPVTTRENVLRGVGIAAKYAKRDKCKNGHLFTKRNTYTWPKRKNARLCKECRMVNTIKFNKKEGK